MKVKPVAQRTTAVISRKLRYLRRRLEKVERLPLLREMAEIDALHAELRKRGAVRCRSGSTVR